MEDRDDSPKGIFAPRRIGLGSQRECKLGQMNIFNIGPTTTRTATHSASSSLKTIGFRALMSSDYMDNNKKVIG